MDPDEAKMAIYNLSSSQAKEILQKLRRSNKGRLTQLRNALMKLSTNEAFSSELQSLLPPKSSSGRKNTRPVKRPRQVKNSPDELSMLPVRGASSFPLHPDVQFIPLAFCEVLGQLVQPSTLVNTSDNACTFHLTPAQAKMIRNGHQTADRFGRNEQYSVQVLVRIGLLETTSAQNDCFPPGLVLYVNNCQLPLLMSNNCESKKSQPLDVTAYIRIDPMLANTIKVICNPTFQRYVIAVYLVQKYTWNTLLGRLRSKALRVANYTKAMIQQKLTCDGENDILTTSLRVSLVCPLGKMRLVHPSRSTTCDHIQCFDASIFLQMNEKKPTWQCPVCNKVAHYDTLIIDEYFLKVVSDNSLPPSCTEIEVTADGGWRPLGLAASIIQAEPSKGGSEVNLDSSDEDIEIIECGSIVSPPKKARKSRHLDPLTVDLVSSSPSPPSSPAPQLVLPPKKRPRRISSGETNQQPPLRIIELGSSSEEEPPDYSRSPEVVRSPFIESVNTSDSEPLVLIGSRRHNLWSSSDDDEPKNDERLHFQSRLPKKRRLRSRRESERTSSPVSYTINKEKSSATSIVIRKTHSPLSGAKEDKVDASDVGVASIASCSKNNESSIGIAVSHDSEKSQIVESLSNFLVSADFNDRSQLLGVLDQVAESLASQDGATALCQELQDLDQNELLSHEVLGEPNEVSVICLDETRDRSNISDGTPVSSKAQDLTPMQNLLKVISQEVDLVSEPPIPIPSTSKCTKGTTLNPDQDILSEINNVSANILQNLLWSPKNVEVCNIVSSTDDGISIDHNYVHRDKDLVEGVTPQPSPTVECQGSVITSTNNDHSSYDAFVISQEEPAAPAEESPINYVLRDLNCQNTNNGEPKNGGLMEKEEMSPPPFDFSLSNQVCFERIESSSNDSCSFLEPNPAYAYSHRDSQPRSNNHGDDKDHRPNILLKKKQKRREESTSVDNDVPDDDHSLSETETSDQGHSRPNILKKM